MLHLLKFSSMRSSLKITGWVSLLQYLLYFYIIVHYRFCQKRYKMKKRKHLNAFILSTIITLLIVYCAVNRYFERFIENYPIVVLSILVLIILAMIGIQIKNRVKEYKKNSKETIKEIKSNLIGALIIILGFILFFVVPCFYVINNN